MLGLMFMRDAHIAGAGWCRVARRVRGPRGGCAASGQRRPDLAARLADDPDEAPEVGERPDV
jgi:hypothetical protein